MAVTDEQVAALRAHLAGDFEEYQRIRRHLDEIDGWDGYTALLAGAFFEAVNRRFMPDETPADETEVIKFVAEARARLDPDGQQIDPRAAERMVLATYTDASISDLDPKTKVRGQVYLLTALLLDEQLDDAELEAFMATAREFGNRLSN